MVSTRGNKKGAKKSGRGSRGEQDFFEECELNDGEECVENEEFGEEEEEYVVEGAIDQEEENQGPAKPTVLEAALAKQLKELQKKFATVEAKLLAVDADGKAAKRAVAESDAADKARLRDEAANQKLASQLALVAAQNN